jgi:predicted TIM-barrel fold metal-dependent hydrolase
MPKAAIAAGRAYRRWRAKGPRLGDWAPESTLELPVTALERASVPAVNFHAHLGHWLSTDGEWMENVSPLLELMGACNIDAVVNLDGRWGRELEDNLDRYDRAHPGKFFTFCHLDWRLLDKREGPDLLVKSLERSVGAGARGLKVWKDLGLSVKVGDQLVLPDDPRLSSVWDAAGNLGIPVLVHVADPVAFFCPPGPRNERLEEMSRHPPFAGRSGLGIEGFHRLVGALENVVAAHPGTTFVAAHGLYPENISYLGAMFDRYPNIYIDIAWVHLQFGRQPRRARELFLRFPDRIVFGTDVFPLRIGILQIYFRFLETADEYFSYTDEPSPGSGRWHIYGLDLPSSALQQIYRSNALGLLGLAARP